MQNLVNSIMLCSYWLTLGPEPALEQGLEKMGCMRLCRMFHTALGLESGPEKSRMSFQTIFQDLKMIPEMSCSGFLITFCYFQ